MIDPADLTFDSAALTPAATPLDPLTLPLWGSRLIEASAGTGKTWTIAALYLRLVLGHGDEASGHGRALLPGQILVMTFTRAATRELSDRIRARLVEAAACFRGYREPAPGDALLRELMAAYPAGPARDQAAWRLAMAAEAMDDAAVHTIDAWCQRMLREHAFDSGSLFDEELQANEAALLAEACRDYWRQEVYPLSGNALDAVLAVWKGVDALHRDVQALLPHVAAPGFVAPAHADRTLDQARAAAQVELTQALVVAKQGWPEQLRLLRDWLNTRLDAKVSIFNKVKLKRASVDTWFDVLDTWAAEPEQLLPELTPAARKRLVPEGLQDARKGTEPIELPPGFAALQAVLDWLGTLAPATDVMRLHAGARVAQRVQQLKRGVGTYGFADMLHRLGAALQGPSGGRLRERIAQQYPVALVDEFQDTSPIQYRIFDKLYDTAANARGTALFLIGDPKQSIYAFRGADIYSYLAARQATRGRHYLLGTNYRSTKPLVDAVNQLFEQAEQRAGRGAFRFRAEPVTTSVTVDNPLPFIAVAAKGRAEQLVDRNGAVPALTAVVDAELLPAREIMLRFAQRCAEHIVSLLNDAQAGFAQADKPLKRLRPGDIAVLVRTGREAHAVRRALAERQVASVYLSDKESVYASREAADLLLWLQAVAEPLNSRLTRAALATATVGLPLAELARLSQDDIVFEQRVDQLRLLASLWRRQGVLPMLRRTLHEFDLPARWLTEPDGERRLTNLLHLAELLQGAAAQLDGEQALIRWLAEQIADPGSAGDEQIVRLESDADLVQVITVHKSKGLEYPVVCLPFASSFRAVSSKGRSFLAVRIEAEVDESTAEVEDADVSGAVASAGAFGAAPALSARRLDFRKSKAALAAADDERLQEDLRLLYVALTRARHAVWLGVGAPKQPRGQACLMHLSALGCLLTGGAAMAAGDLTGLLQTALAGAESAHIEEVVSLSVPRTALVACGDAAPLQDAPVYTARFARDWSIASFSALVRDLAGPHPAPSARHLLADAAVQEELLAEAGDETSPPPQLAPWHAFARGAYAGNFLHELLEWLAGHDFALAGDPALQHALLRRCERNGWGNRADAVLTWLLALVDTPLPPLGVPLSGLGTLLPEMEFWFTSPVTTQARHIDELCRRHLLGGLDRPALPERELRGMLMGFADLVFESGGRFWVLDYKSNALGDCDADYHADALQAAMAQHRYDVQAALYLLALHRLLRLRLGDAYDPARQLGGAIYLFMRGLRGPAAGCVLVEPDAALLDALDRVMAGAVPSIAIEGTAS